MSDPWSTSANSSAQAKKQAGTSDESQVTIKNINAIASAIKEISKIIDQLGTNADGRKLRKQLNDRREETTKMVMDTKTLLQRQWAPSSDGSNVKVLKDRLGKQFNDLVTDYERLAKESERKQREIVMVLETRTSTISGLTTDHERSQTLGGQLKEIQFDNGNIDEAIILEQNNDIKAIERDLEQLAEAFVDVNKELEGQREMLDTVSNNVGSATTNTEEGAKEIKEANRLACSARWKLFVGMAIVLILIALAVIIGVCVTGHCKKG